MCDGGGSGGSQRAMEEQLALQREQIGRTRWEEEQRRARIAQGMNTINQNFWELDQSQSRPEVRALPAPLGESYEEWVGRTGYGAEEEDNRPTHPKTGKPYGGQPVRDRHPKTGKPLGAPVQAQHAGSSPGGPTAEQGFTIRPGEGSGGFLSGGAAQFDAGRKQRRGQERTADVPAAPSIYDQREQAYLDYANPQVDRQFGDASDQLTYQLSRMGHGAGSSAGVRRHGRLGEDYDLSRAQVADTALDHANTARQQVNNEKTRLISLLQSTADPSAISGQISGVIDSIKAAPAFNPLGPLFQNATAGLGSYLDGVRYNQMARSANSVPIYGSGSSGSGRVVR